ncbi:hypothetical protein EAS61_08490 [Bradyrhizobium zhanjiangense]|uniref:Uncharacterized protein n=1 Tax=Bradyrhizobium zhanjiangense TaxID=1325107 RepID=A0A4Q0QVF7_9BRAD|nr:hypothetical protein EAS61_08490 [Bradyrhizobium zhanjiangense]
MKPLRERDLRAARISVRSAHGQTVADRSALQSDPPIWALQLGATAAFSLQTADNGELVDVASDLADLDRGPSWEGHPKVA